MSLKYYIIDTESSGLSSSYHELIEISIIRCSDRVQLTEFIKCDYPERANYDALKIQNKTMADLEYGSSKEEVISKIDKFINEDGLTPGHRCLIAHNAPFDKRFIHALYDKVSKRCPVDLWLCTMALTKQYAKSIGLVKPKVNLKAACDMVGIKQISGAHASKVDSRNTYMLHKKLVDDLKVDYLPLIKTAAHSVAKDERDDEELINFDD